MKGMGINYYSPLGLRIKVATLYRSNWKPLLTNCHLVPGQQLISATGEPSNLSIEEKEISSLPPR
jgi:hypothetical protein